MDDPADGDGLNVGGAVVADPAGVGELLVGEGETLGVCDGLGEWVGRGEVPVGLGVGVAGEADAVDWPAPADWPVPPDISAAVTGRTR